MALLPQAGLPGSDALSFQLVGDWPSIAPAALVATALVRVALVGFLLNLGWSGGPFLPLVYGALCLALGISGLTGADPGPCVAAAEAGVLVSFSGRAAMGALALLCCPPASIPSIAVASLVAALLPRPRMLEGASPRAGREGARMSPSPLRRTAGALTPRGGPGAPARAR